MKFCLLGKDYLHRPNTTASARDKTKSAPDLFVKSAFRKAVGSRGVVPCFTSLRTEAARAQVQCISQVGEIVVSLRIEGK
jgi:hypothetical protein